MKIEMAYGKTGVKLDVPEGVEAIAVCLKNSYLNPAHEFAIKKIIERLAPELPFCVSYDVLPEIKEYERTSTTVINASIRMIEPRNPPDARFQQAFEAGRRALIRCSPYDLPREKFGQWRNIEVVFNPEGMVSW